MRVGARRAGGNNIVIRVAPVGGSRRSSKRRSGGKRKSSRGKARRSPRRYHSITPPSHQLTAGEYALSNPLSGGELTLVAITGVLGYGLADFIGRWVETTATGATAPVAVGTLGSATAPPGATYANDVATLGFPSFQASAAQFAVALIPGIAQGFIESPMARAAAQGVMLGAGLSWLGTLLKGGMAYLLSNTVTGQQLYLAEIEAQTAQGTITPAAGSTSLPNTAAGVSRLPAGMGRGPYGRIPVGRPQTRTGNAQPQGLGAKPTAQLQAVLARHGLTAVPLGRGVGANISATYQPGASSAPSGPIVPSLTSQPLLQPGTNLNPNDPDNLTTSVPGIQTNTGNVLPTPTASNVAAGHAAVPAVSGPTCAPCTSTSGGLAATYDTARRYAMDSGCGLGGIFPED